MNKYQWQKLVDRISALVGGLAVGVILLLFAIVVVLGLVVVIDTLWSLV